VPFCRYGELDMYYEDEGRGAVLLCLHPPCVSSHIYTYLQTELAASWRVLTLDIRGHGRSEAGEAALTMPLMAEDLRRLLDECGIHEAYLCAYGPASLLALHALETYPERFKGGILISSQAAITDIVERSKLEAGLVSSVLQNKEEVARRMVRQEVERAHTLEFETLLHETQQGDPARWKDYATSCLNADYRSKLSGIKQPMLVLQGGEDQVGEQAAQELLQKLPRAEHFVIQRGPRTLLMAEPVRTAAVIHDWLDQRVHGKRGASDEYTERHEKLQELAAMEIVQQGLEGPGSLYK